MLTNVNLFYYITVDFQTENFPLQIMRNKFNIGWTKAKSQGKSKGI